MHQENLNKKETVEDYYNSEEEIYQNIYSNGFSKYVESLPQLPEAFELKDKCIFCIDEGTPGGIHAAGSGILLSDKESKKYFKKIKAEGIKFIASHENCGAAALAVKLYNELHDLKITDIDEYAKKWTEEQARKWGLKPRHINAEEMKRPERGHFARTCYYDLTGSFNWNEIKGLPAGFVISREFTNSDDAAKEVNIALDIAFGNHGLGEKLLNEEKPFLLVVVAKDEEQLESTESELKEIKHHYGNKVKIDGFIKPESKK